MGVTTAGKVITSLEINNSQYMTALRNSQTKLSEFAKTSSSSVSGMGRDFANLARSVVGITVAFQSLRKVIGEGMNFNKFVQEQTAAFSVMMKSADDAKAKIKELYNFAVSSPLTFKETVGASKQLMAYGFAADTLVDNMKMLGTVAKATGHSLEDISYVYGTLKTQGRAYTRDLMQFAMRGIPIYEELAKVLGVDQKQIQKLTSEGKVGFAEVEQAFKNLTGEGGRFFGMLDEYMKTLPGQLSMLGDIAQQSAGRFASGITDALLKGLPGIMDALGDSSGGITALGATLGTIAKSMLKLTEVLIRLIPWVKTFLIMFATGKAIAGLLALPKVLMNIGEAAFVMGVRMAATSTLVSGMGIATSTAAAGVSLLATSFKVLFTTLLASPLFPVMLALAGMGVAISSTIKAADKARADAASLKEANPQEALRQQLKNRVHGTSAEDPLGTAPVIATLAEVAKSAKDFGISMLDATQIYMETGLVTRGVIAEFKTLGDAARAAGEKLKWIQYNEKVKQDYTKAVQGQSWASTLEALGVDIMTAFKATSGVTSEPSVKGYMGMFTQELPDTNIVDAMKTAGVKDTILADQTEDILKQKFKIVQDTLINVISRDFLNPEDTNPKLKEELAKLLNSIQLQLDGLGGKEKIKEVKRDLWYVRELETKATEDKMDDLVLAYDKEKYTAREKLREQEISLEEYYRAIYAIQQKFEDDSIKLAQEANMKLYNTAVGGNSAFFDRLKESAGAAVSSGNYGQAAGAMAMGGTQGTEVGNMMSGGDPITQILVALVKFALSIENLVKLLNPFGTIIEAMGEVIGPILNVAFQGLSSVLEDLGYIIGSVLAPVLNMFALAFQVIAGIIKITILPVLALLGAAFAWFNDKVIVPVGNAIIKAINAVIWALNLIPFVNIAYLDLLKTVAYAAELEDMLGDALDGLANTISYLTKKLNDMIDSQINSLQDLYEVGAMSGAQYSAAVADANKYRIDTDLELVSLADQQLNTMESVFNRLTELLALQKELKNPDLNDNEKLAMLIAAGIMTEANATPLPVQIITPPANDGGVTDTGGTPVPTGVAEIIDATGLGTDAADALVTAVEQTVNYEALAMDALQLAKIAEEAELALAMSYAQAAMATVIGNEIQGYVDALESGQISYDSPTNYGDNIESTADLLGYASGSTGISRNQIAMVHAGETIIPKTFADGIRSGEMVLSGKGGSASMDSGNVTVIVNVQGSVSTENDLATSIAERIYLQRKRGLLTV